VARLAFVGHLTASKRPRRYVEVVQALRAGGLAFDAVMAGDGPLLADMERAAASAGIDVLGRVEDVAGLLAGCDVFVFTSVPDGEGMPGVLIEAGLAGLAVVTTDVPGAGDVVLDGSTGFVVGVDDREALVAQARMLVADEPLRRRFGAAARQHCATRFSLAASIERWDALLAGLLGERCTSST
jgi:glycosyltransferase involved in cell wall biosynthesis